ncbi:unnamed protein product [Sphenostylis stenocarpa]|uniref:Uncharacterized protein n=1 Tax=Sphenostylis stenocarpa TaxID=92480 RepID=A0AA86S2P6_9FABA|nr:unnamed protein product [Sphenostylis stenocarpa]
MACFFALIDTEVEQRLEVRVDSVNFCLNFFAVPQSGGCGRYSCGCTVQTEQTNTAKIPMKIVSISGSSSNFEDNPGQMTCHVFVPHYASSRFSMLHSPNPCFSLS